MDHVGEVDAISNEEDRHVVAHQVPISLASVELDCEATRVTQSLRGLTLVHHSGESDNQGSSLPH